MSKNKNHKNTRITHGSVRSFLLFTIALIIGFSAPSFVLACECSPVSGEILSPYCDDTSSPLCTTNYGAYTGRCECVPDCICGDGSCAYYDNSYGDDHFSCDETESTCPEDCCTSDSTNPACGYCGDGFVKLPEVCDIADIDNVTACAPYTNFTTERTYDAVKTCNANCSGYSSCIVQGFCGDNIINGDEQCDSDLHPANYSVKIPYGGQFTYCNTSCMNVTVLGNHCGDNKITDEEQCEVIGGVDSLNGEACTSMGLFSETGSGLKCYADTCKFNTSGCYKVDGWTPLTNTWSVSSASAGETAEAGASEILHAFAPGTLITDYSFDIKANVSYALSMNILSKNDGCILYVDFNDGNCTSQTDLRTKNCFTTPSTTDSLLAANANTFIFNISSNTHATSGLYFKDVRLRLAAGSGCTNISIDNISLKEYTHISDAVSYDISSITDFGAIATSGCCPADYCWDGLKCVNSDDWMSDSQKGPVWNNILDSSYYAWNNSHVNTSYQPEARGYRCVIVNDTANDSQWVVSDIKYGWNYDVSGYCARETDCFVREDFDAASFDDSLSGYSKGCIRDGDIVSDDYIFDSGNHYCHEGQWTTKSYIIATKLQNISSSVNKPYILQCYDDTSIVYNTMFGPSSGLGIVSACVLIKQDGINDEQIITGVVLEDASSASSFITAIVGEYSRMWGDSEEISLVAAPASCVDDPLSSQVSGTNFSRCVETSNNKLYVYYEYEHKYFLISDGPITGLTRETLWQRVAGFFKDLFSKSSKVSTIQSYNIINQTTSYDKIYIMRNSTLNVTALEDTRYDEAEQAIVNILYVHYTGSNNITNPIDKDALLKKVNESMVDLDQTGIVVLVEYTNTSTDQEILIRSQGTTGAWRYLTSILRNRP